MKKLTKLMLVLAQLGLIGAAHAASVSLSPTSQPVVLGNSVSFAVNVDFTGTPTSKGWFDLSYDSSILNLTNFTYNSVFTAGLTTIPVSTATIGNTGYVNNIGFVGAVSGSGTLGTVTFSTASTGSADLNTLASFGFRNSGDTGFLSVSYSGANAQVSAVPVPAALWLMASGLGALGLGLRRRRA